VLHKVTDNESKQFHFIPCYLCKSSWNFSKKSKCNDILFSWKITFQASDLKGCQFLNLCDKDNNLLELSYMKGGMWLKYFRYSNSLCIRATRAIINCAPIRKYRLRFFPRKDFSCLCGNYLIETRCYILYKYRRYNKYWNLRRDSISHFTLFLDLNSDVFLFESTTT